MSTEMKNMGALVRISTLISEGGRKKQPRGSVMVDAADLAAVRAEVIRQAELARKVFNVDQPSSEPVV